ncbi:hypothetical protein CERZMDRAFT_4463, partial [Cercospora zeae-maydis SCOH1-5]
KADIILVQEPWIILEELGTARPILHPSFTPILPITKEGQRPRTCIYTRRNLEIEASPDPLDDPDIQSLYLRDSQGNKIQVLNVYNERDKNGNWTAERSLYSLSLSRDAILAGDFNIRHP